MHFYTFLYKPKPYIAVFYIMSVWTYKTGVAELKRGVVNKG